MPKETTIRIAISVVSILIATAHLLFPSFEIDLITMGLLVLAALPWVSPIIKSFEIPGLGKVELQEIRKQAQEARGAAQSANRKAELALADDDILEAIPRNTLGPPTPESLERLAAQYNHIRDTQKSGSARTRAMTQVVKRMIKLASQADSFDVEKALCSKDRGIRLSAFAYLYSRPDTRYLDLLVDVLTQIEDKPFSQYWAIQSIGKIVGEADRVDGSVLEKLSVFYSRLRPGTDREYELRTILRELNTLKVR